jgi:predicted TIM-barrel enzyme
MRDDPFPLPATHPNWRRPEVVEMVIANSLPVIATHKEVLANVSELIERVRTDTIVDERREVAKRVKNTRILAGVEGLERFVLDLIFDQIHGLKDEPEKLYWESRRGDK